MASDSKERLSQARAEEHARNLEAGNLARQANAAEIGAKLGQTVDFSQGIPMGPPPTAAVGSNRVPQRPDLAIPKPPSQTRQEEIQQSQDEAEAEREAYNEAMREAGIPSNPVVDPAQFAARPQRPLKTAPLKFSPPQPARPQKKKLLHPLLTQLRSEFGIGDEAKPPIEVKVAEHSWTFVPLSPDMIATVSRWSDNLAETAGEHAVRTRQAAVCCSIVAVDGTPVWEMMGLTPLENDDTSFPLLPKGTLRQRAALSLFVELTDGMKNRLLDALIEAYLAKVDPEGSVAGYTAYEKVDHIVWVCPGENCEHKLVRPPRPDDAPYHCEFHGLAMVNMSIIKPGIDEALSPLL